MKTFVAVAFAFAVSVSGAAISARAAPAQVDAEYQLFRNGLLVGRVVESYVRRGNEYAIESTTRAEGVLKLFLDDSLVVNSTGRVGPQGLQPLTYSQRRLGRPDRDVNATFDWKAGVIHSQYRGEAKDIELPPGTQDRLSVMYQFMNVAPKGDEVEIPMSNGRKVDHYTYRRTETVKVTTPAGEFDTWHYERVPREGSERRASVWIARDHHRLPVRVSYEENGAKLDQRLVGLKAQ